MDIRSDELPLLRAQQGIWLGQRLRPNSPAYNAAELIALPGSIDLARFSAAAESAVREVEALHVRFVARGGDVAQLVVGAPEGDAAPRVHDFRGQADPEHAARRFVARDLAEPFCLERAPLYRHALLRVSDTRTLWYFCAHHAALDGFGFTLVFTRVAEHYGARATRGETAGLRALLDEEARYRASPAFALDRAFWHGRLAHVHDVPSYSAGETRGEGVERLTHTITPEAHARLVAAVQKRGATWVDAYIAALAIDLQRTTKAEHVVLGLPMMLRQDSCALRVPSMTMNIVPLVLPVRGEMTLADVLRAVVEERRALAPHARYRYEELRRELRRLGAERPLFGPVINVMPFAHTFRFGDARLTAENVSAGPVEDIAIGAASLGAGRGVALRFEGHADRYTAEAIHEVLLRFVRTLDQLAHDPNARLRVARAPQVLPRGSITWGPRLERAASDVVARFDDVASTRPDATAVEHGTERLRYGELAARSDALAAHLATRGVRPGALVALALPRGTDAVVAILAVLKSGAAYLPLDPSGPEERMRTLLDDARPALLVTNTALRRRLPWPEDDARIVDVRAVGEAPRAAVDARDSAYVMYTSGSTGRPNGVLIERGALAHFVAAAQDRYALSAADRVLQFAPLHFDASVEEIFCTLTCGATLVLRTDAMLDSLQTLLGRCAELAISVLDLPTAVWNELVNALARGDLQLPDTLRLVIIGGEAALPERVATWRRAVGERPSLLNTYGPTETTVVALSSDLSHHEGDAVPVGRPLAGVGALVLTGAGAPATPGEVGELVLFGPTLARGYLARHALDEERFVSFVHDDGALRGYRTGDHVRARGDGELCFVGRRDDELKISGQRIDPSEVENVLLASPGVEDAALVVTRDAGHAHRITAFVVWRAGAPREASLRAHAERHLLAVAVPSRFVAVARLPRTGTGKVDRKALAATLAEAHPVAPSPALTGAHEHTIYEALRDALGTRGLGRDDDVFELGLQSLQAIQVATRLSGSLKRDVPAALLFQHPSVARLARALGGTGNEAAATRTLSAQLQADLALGARLPRRIRPRGAGGHTLLTGATGFVGIHLLAELLRDPGARVLCLVRARDANAGLRRLAESARRHALGALAWERVAVVPGNLGAPALGLTEARFHELARQTSVVFHCAASVSLTRGYESMRSANVLATLDLLRFALEGATRAFHHVSTIAAAHVEHGALDDGLRPDRPVERDGYSASKWLAEQLVHTASERGLHVGIYRLARVSGALATASVNADDLVWRVLRAGVSVAAVPELPVSEPWTPVDAVATAIVALGRDLPAGCQLYQLTGDTSLDLREVFEWARRYGYPLESTTLTEFQRRVRTSGAPEALATLAFFEAGERRTAHTPTSFVSPRTRAALAARGVTLPSTDEALMRRYLASAVHAGILPPPKASTSTRLQTHPETDLTHGERP